MWMLLELSCEVLMYGFLYHQMEDKIMIHYVTSDEEARQVSEMYSSAHKLDPMLIDLRKDNYMIRIVFSQNRLLEKLAIIDAGLDDRLVEIYKVFLLANLQQQEKPELKGVEIFFLDQNGKHFLQIIADHKNIGFAEMSMKTYRLLSEQFSGALPERGAQTPFVDRSWALDFLKLAQR